MHAFYLCYDHPTSPVKQDTQKDSDGTNPTSYNLQDQRKNDNTEGLHLQLMGMMSYWSLAFRLIQHKLRAPIAIQSWYHLIANLLIENGND